MEKGNQGHTIPKVAVGVDVSVIVGAGVGVSVEVGVDVDVGVLVRGKVTVKVGVGVSNFGMVEGRVMLTTGCEVGEGFSILATMICPNTVIAATQIPPTPNADKN